MFVESLLSEILDKPIHHLQIAADGIWEDAKPVSVSPPSEEIETLMAWLSDAPKDIAIEAFFGNKDSDSFFFYGIRIEELPREAQKEFVRNLFNAISDSSNFDALLNAVKKALNDQRIMQTKPDMLELGAEGFWKSYGSYVVWRKEETQAATIQDVKRETPQLLQPFERAIMMEFAWHKPLPMWLGLPVSKKEGNEFHFSSDIYQTLLNKVSLG